MKSILRILVIFFMIINMYNSNYDNITLIDVYEIYERVKLLLIKFKQNSPDLVDFCGGIILKFDFKYIELTKFNANQNKSKFYENIISLKEYLENILEDYLSGNNYQKQLYLNEILTKINNLLGAIAVNIPI